MDKRYFFLNARKNRYKIFYKGKNNLIIKGILTMPRKENKNMSNQENKKKLPIFYIALCCCVLAIGFGGYISENNKATEEIKEEIVLNETPQEDETPVSETIIIEENDTSSTPETPPEETPTESSSPAPQGNEPNFSIDNPDIEQTAVEVNASEPYFHIPVGGEIVQGFTEKLIYNEGMDDWRTHNGIDILADLGCSVSACADGIVEEVFEDALGNGISIKHANGFTSKYMCLGNVENFKAGDEIKSGEIIGTIGTPKGESITEPHLHFELHDEKTLLNPEQYLN